MAAPSPSEKPSPDQKPQIEIASDEDWKERVKAEDARRDADAQEESSGQTMSPAPETEATEEEDFSQLPPASFFTLLQMLSTQSIVALGLIPTPRGETTVQLPVAKHFIDLLTILEQKCKGNLSADEQRFLDGTLHELRMAYVAATGKQGESV